MFDRGEELYFELPSDKICLDGKAYLKLLSLWVEDTPEKLKEWYKIGNVWPYNVPADILKAETIPLPSFVLNLSDISCKDITILTDTVAYNKVVASTEFGFNVWYKRLSDEWKMVADPYKNGETSEMYKHILNDEKFREEVFLTILACWYGIQIALLHPQLQVLFQNPTKEKVYTREGTGKDRKRVVKYIRKHYITPEGIDEALYGHGHRDFERKTMAWYVIGHWRQYKNGTRKFIKGYWKGPLREMKRNLDGGRIRQLAIQEA